MPCVGERAATETWRNVVVCFTIRDVEKHGCVFHNKRRLETGTSLRKLVVMFLVFDFF